MSTGEDAQRSAEQLSEHLEAVARSLPMSSVDVTDVQWRVRRMQRRRRTRAFAAVAAVALVGFVGVVQLTGGDDAVDDVGVTTESTPTSVHPITTSTPPSPNGGVESTGPSEFGPDPVVWQDALWLVSGRRVVRSVDGQTWVEAGPDVDGAVRLELVVSGERLFIVDSTLDEVAVWSSTDGQSWTRGVAFDRPFGISQVTASNTHVFFTVRSGPTAADVPGGPEHLQAQRELAVLIFERFGAMASLSVSQRSGDGGDDPVYLGTVEIWGVPVWQGPLTELGLTEDQIDLLYRTPLASPDDVGPDSVVDSEQLGVRRFASADGVDFVELDPQADAEVAIRSNLGIVTNTTGGVLVLSDPDVGPVSVQIPTSGPILSLVATDIGVVAQSGGDVLVARDDLTGWQPVDLGVQLGDIVEFVPAPGSVGILVWHHSDDPEPRLVVLDDTGERRDVALEVPQQADRWRWELWPLPNGDYRVDGRTVDQAGNATTVTTQTIEPD